MAGFHAQDLEDATAPTAAKDQMVAAAPAKVTRNRSEIRPRTRPAATTTKPTPPTSRTDSSPANSAASEPKPRPARSGVLQMDGFQRPSGSGRFFIAAEICIRQPPIDTPNKVALPIRAPTA